MSQIIRSVITVVVFFVMIVTSEAEGNTMSTAMTINVDSQKERIEYGAPIPVRITFTNGTDKALTMLFDSSLEDNVRVGPRASEKVSRKEQVFFPSIEVAPRLLDAGRAYSVTVWLNKLLRFGAPGEFQIEYRVRAEYYQAEQPLIDENKEIAEVSGVLTITLVRSDTNKLGQRLSVVAAGLKSKDMVRRSEAVEALCHLDDQACIGYMADILSLDDTNHKLTAIRALSRFATPRATEILKKVISTEDDPVIVEATLQELGKREVILSPERIRGLLRAANPGIKLATIDYVQNQGNSKNLALLRSLQDDKNPLVVKRARVAIEKLKEK